MQDAIDEGRDVRAHDYLAAVDWIDVLNAGLDRIFERYDAILTPSCTGCCSRRVGQHRQSPHFAHFGHFAERRR